MDGKLITVPEAAESLRVSRSTIWRWCKNGVLTSAFKIGRNWRIHRTEMEGIIKKKPLEFKDATNLETDINSTKWEQLAAQQFGFNRRR